MKKKLKEKHKNILLRLLSFFCIGILFYNVFILIQWNIDRNHIIKEIEEIDKIINIKEIVDTEEVELVNSPKENIPNDYRDYIKLPLIDVDLKEMKKINKDTVGFLNVAGTNINYPVVQAKDNMYYLEHSFQNKFNKAGWIFMDHNNKKDFTDKNTVIYGHARVDTTMFGSLKNLLNSSWINNKNNYIIRYVTENEAMMFQVFSVYTIPEESYYIQTTFNNDIEYKKWLYTMIKRSNYDFNATVDEKDTILTLSTCKNSSSNQVRLAVHSKLIKKLSLNH